VIDFIVVARFALGESAHPKNGGLSAYGMTCFASKAEQARPLHDFGNSLVFEKACNLMHSEI
jgi:hypothetical protein